MESPCRWPHGGIKKKAERTRGSAVSMNSASAIIGDAPEQGRDRFVLRRGDLELNWPLRLALHHRGSVSHAKGQEVVNP